MHNMITEVHTNSQTVDANTIPMADYRQSEKNGISFSNRVKEIIKNARARTDNSKQLKNNNPEEDITKFTVFPFQIKEDDEENGINGNHSNKESVSSFVLNKELWNIKKENKSQERITLENILNLKQMIVINQTKDIKTLNESKNQKIEDKGDTTSKKSYKESENKNFKTENVSASFINNLTSKQDKNPNINSNNNNKQNLINDSNKQILDQKFTERNDKKLSDNITVSQNPETKAFKMKESIESEKNGIFSEKINKQDNTSIANISNAKINANNHYFANSESKINHKSQKASTKIGDLRNTYYNIINPKKSNLKSDGIDKSKELINNIEQKIISKSERVKNDSSISNTHDDLSTELKNKQKYELTKNNVTSVKLNTSDSNDVQLVNRIKENIKNDSEIKAKININIDNKSETTDNQQNIKAKISDLIKLIGNKDDASDLEHISFHGKKKQTNENIEPKSSYGSKIISDPFNHKETLNGFSKGSNDLSDNKNKKDNDQKSLNNLINVKTPQTQTSELSVPKSNLGDSSFSQNSKIINLQEFGNTALTMIKNTPNNTIHSARLTLQPQSLGTVMIEISLANNIAKLDIRVDSREAAKSIESQLGVLKEKLANEGIKIESADVKLSNFEKDTKNNNGQDSGFAKREETNLKKEYLNTFGFLKDTPEIDEQDRYKSIRNFIEQGNSFGNYLQQ